MNPVQPEELSALLDGELDPARAAEVRTQIQMDPALRKEFESLSGNDVVWRAAADSVAFTPDVDLSLSAEAHALSAGEGTRWLAALAVTLGGLVVVRSVLKLTGSGAWGLALPAVSLLVLIALVVWLARMSSHDASSVQTGTGRHA